MGLAPSGNGENHGQISGRKGACPNFFTASECAYYFGIEHSCGFAKPPGILAVRYRPSKNALATVVPRTMRKHLAAQAARQDFVNAVLLAGFSAFVISPLDDEHAIPRRLHLLL
jgi:hypothetical protein